MTFIFHVCILARTVTFTDNRYCLSIRFYAVGKAAWGSVKDVQDGYLVLFDLAPVHFSIILSCLVSLLRSRRGRSFFAPVPLLF